MATYFVRKTGLDANNGLSAGAAFLTIGKAASVVAAGDTVYIGGGTYREVVQLTTAGSAGNYISYIGDVDGVQTGDSGDVIMTGWTTDDKSTPSTHACIRLNAKAYQAFKNILFFGSGTLESGCVIDGGNGGAVDHVQFTACGFVGNVPSVDTVFLQITASAVTAVFLFDSCFFFGAYSGLSLAIQFLNNASVDNNVGGIIRNCLFIAGDRATCIILTSGGGGAFHAGGVLISQCQFWGGDFAVDASNTLSSQYVVSIVGCYMFGQSNALTSGGLQTIEDWNVIDANVARVVGSMPAGANSVAGRTYSPTWESWGAFVTGRSARPFGQPMVGSELLGWLPQSMQIAVGVPTTTTDDATVGTIAWTNPNNSQRLDAAYATNVLTASATGHYLDVTGLGFAIPGTATIKAVRVDYYADQTGAGTGVGNSIKLIKGGVIGGTDEVASMPALTGGLVYASIGGAGDLWGNTLTPTDVNAANFGVAISFKNTSGASAATVQLDYIRVYVEYTDTTNPTEHATDFGSGIRPAGPGSGGTPANIAVGAWDRGGTAVKDTVTFDVGPSSARIDGPGYQDFVVAVDAVATTITAKLRWNSSYTGTLPQLRVLGGTEAGVANQTVTATGSANAWNTTSITFTPTSKGVLTIRFVSLSTAAAGSAWIDTAS